MPSIASQRYSTFCKPWAAPPNCPERAHANATSHTLVVLIYTMHTVTICLHSIALSIMVVHKVLELADSLPDVSGTAPHIAFSSIHAMLEMFFAQASDWPASEAPLFMPEYVTILLSLIGEINQKWTEKLWSHLIDRVWVFAEERKLKWGQEGEIDNLTPSSHSMVWRWKHDHLCTTWELNRDGRIPRNSEPSVPQNFGPKFSTVNSSCFRTLPWWSKKSCSCACIETGGYHFYDIT